MYVAYSEILHRMVNVSEAFDLKEIFCCPNRNCSARLVIRGATGKRAKHFLTLSSATHINGCEYENLDGRYQRPELQQKSSLEDIFDDFSNPKTNPGTSGEKKTSSKGTGILRINTPSKLLSFCRWNPLETEYLQGITVNDIIVDERNLIRDRKFEGVVGLRLIVGETVKYEGNQIYLVTKVTTEGGLPKYLNTTINLEPDLFREVKKYILETQNGRFRGFKLAVFGIWKKDREYWSSCEVFNQKHVILKF